MSAMKENSFITLPPEGAAEMRQRGRVVAVRVAGDVDRVAVQAGAHVAVAVHLEMTTKIIATQRVLKLKANS